MFWERKLEHWVDHIRENAALPLRLQLWNGRHFDFGKQAPKAGREAPGVRYPGCLGTPLAADPVRDR